METGAPQLRNNVSNNSVGSEMSSESLQICTMFVSLAMNYYELAQGKRKRSGSQTKRKETDRGCWCIMLGC